MTERDGALIATVFEYRVLDTGTISTLLFGSSDSDLRQAQRRLRKWVAGYLERGEMPVAQGEGSKPYIYYIGRLGAELLAARERVPLAEMDWRPKAIRKVAWPRLDHVLACARVRAAVTLAAELAGWSVEMWVDDAELKRRQEYVELTGPDGSVERTAFVPDAFMVLRGPEDAYHCFWEIDRGGLTGRASRWQRRSWEKKVRAYQAFHASGAYTHEYGTADMRLLTVTTGPRRLENLKKITAKAGGRGRFWFSTLAEMDPERVLTGSIWQVPGRKGRRQALLGERRQYIGAVCLPGSRVNTPTTRGAIGIDGCSAESTSPRSG